VSCTPRYFTWWREFGRGHEKWANIRPFVGRNFHRMLRIVQNDRIPITMSSKLTACPWPTLQRAKVNLTLISTCIKKKKTRNRSRLVCMYIACCKGSNVLFHQAYPEMRKTIMKMRSIQAQIRFILTRSRPLFKANSPQGPIALRIY
jgi:hypothetical protein